MLLDLVHVVRNNLRRNELVERNHDLAVAIPSEQAATGKERMADLILRLTCHSPRSSPSGVGHLSGFLGTYFRYDNLSLKRGRCVLSPVTEKHTVPRPPTVHNQPWLIMRVMNLSTHMRGRFRTGFRSAFRLRCKTESRGQVLDRLLRCFREVLRRREVSSSVEFLFQT